MLCHKTFIVVRNPLDAIPSLAAFVNTSTHSLKPDYDLALDYPEYWTWFVKRTARHMKRYFSTILEQCRSKRHPLYIVRYEDLVLEPKTTLVGLMSFLLESKDLQGSNVERRIEQIIAQGAT